MDSGAIPFKVFGLQRTGTNLMRALLSSNFHVEYLEEKETGWKHGPLRLPGGVWRGQPARFVLCVKNPYAWAVSCYHFFRNSVGGDPTMAPQFQRDPSMSFEEFLLTPSYGFASPIHRWSQMNRLWLNTLPADRTLVVRQEDQLNDQMPALLEAELKLQLKRRGLQLTCIDQRVDVDVKLRGTMNRHYYVDRQYMEEYSQTLLDRVNGILDVELMRRFAYPLERWTLAERQIGPMSLIVRPFTTDPVEALHAAGDPYRFMKIKEQGDVVTHIVDGEAGIGASVLLAQGLWPAADVVACEACPQRARLLRINTRHLVRVTAKHAALTGRQAGQIPVDLACQREDCCRHADPETSRATMITFPLDRLIESCGELQLLKFGAATGGSSLLQTLIGARFTHRIGWIAGQIADGDRWDDILRILAQTHHVETWTTPGGKFLLAARTG